MSFLKELKSWLRPDSDSVNLTSVNRDNPLFVYVKLPIDIDPLDRFEVFADPLQETLESADLGTVTGGGSQLSAPDDEGERSVEFCGIDVDLYDVKKGLALLRRELLRLEVPKGTVLLYELDGQEYEEPIVKTHQ